MVSDGPLSTAWSRDPEGTVFGVRFTNARTSQQVMGRMRSTEVDTAPENELIDALAEAIA
jgi:hypothetical protein